MIYISTAQLGNDCMNWASQLPRFAAIVGVPRAGSVIASLLAQYQNNHLISINDLICRNESWKQGLRRNCPASHGSILVVDDTVSTGQQLAKVRQQLAGLPYDLKFGAYLAVNTSGLDYWYQIDTNNSHLFQLNLFHHWFDRNIMTDLDGVLSEDWTHDHETGDLEATYRDHLNNSRCLMKPTFPMHSIVIGRLEIHRAATEAWLARHGIQYGQLIMYPSGRVEDRHDVGIWKGKHYARTSDAMLFVESCPWQSQQIRQHSGKQVIDWQNQKLV